MRALDLEALPRAAPDSPPRVGAHELLVQLRAARGDGSYAKRLFRFTTPDGLDIDDLGLRGLAQDGPADLYETSAAGTSTARRSSPRTAPSRSGRRCSGNRCSPAPRWTAFLHHAHVLVIEGDSYRNPPPIRRKKAQAVAAEVGR